VKLIKRILKGVMYAALVFVVVLLAAGVWLVRRPWPQVKGTLEIAGLAQPVRIVRDAFGIPNIYAKNERDLFFAQGYVHAQDRLWQMQFNRIVCRGALSSLFGKSVVESDQYMRTIGLVRAAEKDWALASPTTRSYLEAYSTGVNAYIDSHLKQLPLEFLILGIRPQRWTPIDTIAWSKMVAFSMSQNHTLEIKRAHLIATIGPEAAQQLLPPYSEGAALIIPADVRSYAALARDEDDQPRAISHFLTAPDQVGGSNSWVIAGAKTESGKPILGNDTHLGLSMPSIWYENGLHGGRFDCVGYSLPGAPFVVIGHNSRIAWGISNMCSDVQDLYLEKLDDENEPARYQAAGGWENLQVIQEKISVKGGSDEWCRVLITRHGPIVNDVMDLEDGAPMALRWTALEGGHLLDAMCSLDQAADWTAFRAAVSNWDAPSMNFVYADVDGNIGYQATGKIPIRAPGHQGLVPAPGDTDQCEWQGYIPFDELPSVLNPAVGYIVAANNKVVPDSYPYHIAHDYGDPYRATRLTQLIAAANGVSVRAAEQIQTETFSIPAESLRPYLIAMEPENELQRKALEEVRSWDLRFTEDSVGASIYYVWYWHLIPNIVADELGDELMKELRGVALNQTPMFVRMMSQPNSPWFDDRRTQAVETREDIIRKSFVDALSWLTEHDGQDPAAWTWGRLHTISFTHQPLGQSGIGLVDWVFNSKTIPVPGEAFSVNATLPSMSRPFGVVFGVSQRLLVDLSDLERSESVNSTGQSGQAFNRHRDDQIPLWKQAGYHALPFGEGSVQAHAASVLTLNPR